MDISWMLGLIGFLVGVGWS